MRTILLFLSLCGALFLQSCDGDLILSPEEKLDGEWYFDKVTYTKPLTIIPNNVTDDYENVRLILRESGQANYIDESNDLTYSGRWDLDSRYDYYDEDNDGNYDEYIDFLEIDLFGNQNGERIYYFWRCETLTRNKIVAYEVVGNRRYRYRLKKR